MVQMCSKFMHAISTQETKQNTNLFEESCPKFGLLMKNVPISSLSDIIHEILLASVNRFTSSIKNRLVQFLRSNQHHCINTMLTWDFYGSTMRQM